MLRASHSSGKAATTVQVYLDLSTSWIFETPPRLSCAGHRYFPLFNCHIFLFARETTDRKDFKTLSAP